MDKEQLKQKHNERGALPSKPPHDVTVTIECESD